mgnify:FL=1
MGYAGGALCEVRQVASLDPTRPPPPEAGEGYYLAVSPNQCQGGRRFTYTEHAWPPEGTSVQVDRTSALRPNIDDPFADVLDELGDSTIGEACDFRYDNMRSYEGVVRTATRPRQVPSQRPAHAEEQGAVSLVSLATENASFAAMSCGHLLR